jgi:hypothetical protein
MSLYRFFRTDNAVKNHWNSTLKRRRNEYAPGGPLDVSAITAALQRRLACAGTDDGKPECCRGFVGSGFCGPEHNTWDVRHEFSY